MSDRAADLLSFASDLERRDSDVAARHADVVALLGRVDDVRARASCTRAALEALPRERLHAEQALADAQTREAEARRELTDAEARLQDAGRSRRASEASKAEAERAVRRAETALSDATAGVVRAGERVAALTDHELALGDEAESLGVEAGVLAHEVAEEPRLSESGRAVPGRTLEEIEEWGARVHAALFVVRGGLENERERIVLEANALAASVLGEQIAGTSVALVRRRLEAALSAPKAG